MADNLYFIESIYTPTDSTKSVVSLLSARENEQTVIVRNLEEQQLKMYNHMGTIREGWYVYYDEGKQVPFGYGNLSHYAREQFREYYVLRNHLVGRLIDADSEAAIVPSCFQGKKTKVTSYHINVGHGNCSIVLIEAGSFYQIWMVDCSIIDKTDHWRSYKGNLELCFHEIARKLGKNKDAKLHIDRFFLTHAHHDHYSGVEYLINNRLIDARTLCYVNIYYQMAGKAYNKMLKALNDAKVKILEPISDNSKEAISFLHPEKRIYRSKATVKNTADDYRVVERPVNDSSVVLSINAGGKTMVFPGDLEQEGYNKMSGTGNCGPHLFDADFYVVAHHGSLNGHPTMPCRVQPQREKWPMLCIKNNLKKVILMGRNGAYSKIYSQQVVDEWNQTGKLVISENAPHFVELDWEYEKEIMH
jgi:hypothetical protein